MTTQTSKLKVEIDTTGERTKVKGLATDLNKLTTAGSSAAKNADSLSKSIKKAGDTSTVAAKQADVMSRSMKLASGAFVGLSGTLGAAQFIKDIAELEGINSRISGLTNNLANDQQFLKKTAEELSAEYITLAGGYAQLLPLYDAQVVSLQQVRDLTTGLANVQAKAGASNDDLKLSIRGLSQALSTGNVNYEDYKQVTESLPGLNNKIAASFNMTSGELKALISTGQLTSQEFGVKAVEALKSYDGAASALSGNLTQTFNRTKNAYTEVVAAFSEPVGNAAQAGAEALADALLLVAEHANEIVVAAEIAGVAIGGMFVGKAATNVAKFVTDTTAAARAILAASEASNAATVAETAAGAARTRNNAIDVVRTANAVKAAAATNDMAESNAALVISETRLAEAKALTATATNTAALSYTRATQAALTYNSSLATLATTSTAARTAMVAAVPDLGASRNAIITNDVAEYYRNVASSAEKAEARVVGFGQSAGAAGKSAKTAAASTAALGVAAKTAATNTAAASLAVTGATLKHRAYQVSVLASAAATRAFSGAVALLGGPVGAAFVAASAVAYLALRQSEAEKTARELYNTIQNLNEEFAKSPDAARSAVDKERELGIAQRKRLEEQLAGIQEAIDAYEGEGRALDRLQNAYKTTEGAIQNINDKLADSRAKIDDLNQALANDKFTSWSDIARTQAAAASAALHKEADSVQAAINKFFPEREKLAALDELKTRLEAVKNVIPVEEYEAGRAAIDKQIAKLSEHKDASGAAAQAARELQAALDAALPEQARINDFNAQVETLEKGLKRGAISTTEFAVAMAGLQDEFDRPALEAAKEKADALNEALGNRISTSYGEYADEVRMLNDALVEATGNADLQSKINLALANIDAEIRADLTIVEGDTESKVQASLDRQRQALQEFHTERQVSAEAAQADLDALNLDAARKQEDLATQLRDRLASLTGARDAITIEFDYADTTSELDRMLEDGKLNIVEYHDAVEAAYKEHQEKLREIVRSGEATQTQEQSAFLNDRVAGIAAKYEDELAVAKDFATALVDTRINKETREATAAQSVAQEDAAAAAEALEAYKKNGTEENKIAYENAKKKAAISEAAAKVQFEQQKKASIAGAKLSAGLAVANALATSPWYVGLAQAAIAIYKTNDIIAGIKSQTYASPSAASYGSSSGSSTGATFGSNTTGSTSTDATTTAATTERLVVFVGDFRSEEEAMFEVGRQQRRLFEEGYINSTPDGLDFGNVPDRTIRLS